MLNEVSHQVSGVVTVNGAAPTRDASYCGLSGNVNDALGTITFTEPTKGYTATYGFTCTNTAGGFAFSLPLPVGTYDVRVARSTYSSAASVNLLGVNYLAQTGLVVNAPVANLVLAEQSYEVSGTVTVNGAPPTRDASYCGLSGNVNDALGTITFTEPTKGYTATYGFTCANTLNGFAFSLALPAGAWDVRVARSTYSSAASVNLLGVNYLAKSGLVVSGTLSNLLLAEVSHQVSGLVTVNGAPPTRDASYCGLSGNVNDALGTITFTEPTKGYTAIYGFTCTNTAGGFAFSLPLPVGTYEVRVARSTYSSAAAVNLLGVNYLAQTNLVVSGPVSNLLLAEVSHPVSGSVTVNGAPPTRDASYCGLSGNVNDALGTITFTEPTKGYTATYGFTCTNTAGGFTFSLPLPVGTYDVRVARATYSNAAAVNLLAVNYLAQTGLVVSGPVTNLQLSEVSHQVSGSVTVNGAAPTRDSTYCAASGNVNDALGTITFTEPTKGYTATYGFTCTNTAGGFTFSLPLPAGTYEVRVARSTYSNAASVNLLGVNYLAQSGLVVSGPVSNLQLAEVSYVVSGLVTVNGAPPTRDVSYCGLSGNVNDALGTITFTDPTKGYTATYGFTCSNTAGGFSFSLPLAPGSYDVRLARSTYSTAASVNLLGVSYLAVTRLRVP